MQQIKSANAIYAKKLFLLEEVLRVAPAARCVIQDAQRTFPTNARQLQTQRRDGGLI
jgi:hypothetical protein